ncbi:MAG: hypothetical protein AAGG09_03095 [Pseudomonadota bacterium]
MKEPLTVKFFQNEVKPHIKNSGEYKNLENHVKGAESLEKNWKSKPLDPMATKLLNNSLNNIEKCLNAVKKPNDALKGATGKVSKAIKAFKDEHNKKFVAKVDAFNLGTIPGGMKAMKDVGVKEYTPENTEFRNATNSVKADDSQKLLDIHKKIRPKINLSSGLFKSYDAAAAQVKAKDKELKDAAKAGDNEARKTLLGEYKVAVKDLYNNTTAARNEIIRLQKDGINRLKKELRMS